MSPTLNEHPGTRVSRNPIRAEQAFTPVHHPIITNDGHRIAGLHPGDRRALLQALLVFGLIPNADFSLLTQETGFSVSHQA